MLLAEIVSHYYPRLVDLHNYRFGSCSQSIDNIILCAALCSSAQAACLPSLTLFVDMAVAPVAPARSCTTGGPSTKRSSSASALSLQRENARPYAEARQAQQSVY